MVTRVTASVIFLSVFSPLALAPYRGHSAESQPKLESAGQPPKQQVLNGQACAELFDRWNATGTGASGPLTAERAALAAMSAGFRVLEVNAEIPLAVRSAFPFTWLDYDDERLVSLRKNFKLANVIANASDEWTAQRMLKNWVHQTITLGTPAVRANHAQEILDFAIQGEPFWCSHYCITFAECATALGWQSRKLGIDRPHGPLEPSWHHGVSDIWSNQFQKWVLIDAMYDLHFEKDGIPLSAWEIRAEFLKNSGADVQRIVGPPANAEAKETAMNYIYQHLEDETGLYFWIYYVDHAFESGWEGNSHMIFPQDAVNASLTWFQNDDPPKPGQPHGGYRRNLFLPTWRIEDVHWSVGIVEAIVQGAADGAIQLGLHSYCPNREGYEVSMNGKAWEPVVDEHHLNWPLTPGGNSLKVHTLSQGGVRGPDTEIHLQLQSTSASQGQ